MASILIGNTIFLPNLLKDMVNRAIEKYHLDIPGSHYKDEFAIILQHVLTHPISREGFTREEIDEIYEKIFAGTHHEWLFEFPRGTRPSRNSGINGRGKPTRRKKTRRKKTRRKKSVGQQKEDNYRKIIK